MEFAWSDAARALLGFGADPNCLQQQSHTIAPGSCGAKGTALEAGAEINFKDCDNLVPLYIAASWGPCEFPVVLVWSGDVVTNLNDNMSVNDGAPIEGVHHILVPTSSK